MIGMVMRVEDQNGVEAVMLDEKFHRFDLAGIEDDAIFVIAFKDIAIIIAQDWDDMNQCGFSPVPISSVPRKSARRFFALPGRSGCCCEACGDQPNTKITSKLARIRPSGSLNFCAYSSPARKNKERRVKWRERSAMALPSPIRRRSRISGKMES